MTKTILLTGATDGIGLETAKALVGLGHTVLVHGRSEAKLANTVNVLAATADGDGDVESYRADLSRLWEVEALAADVSARHSRLDVLINNAGVFKLPTAQTDDGLDARFVVNTIAPYLLTRRLLPLLPSDGRVINLSSAAQAPVDLKALAGERRLGDNETYAQSKLALTMWSAALATELGNGGPAIVAVNPGSLLASKMVKEAYGIEGKDIGVGADILVRAALSGEFAAASGRYFDNDSGQFARPHPDALDEARNAEIVRAIEGVLAETTN